MKNENVKDPKIEELLQKLGTSREELSKYMNDVDALRQKIDQLFPQTNDFRNKWALEEKIKTVASFYSTLLNIRQEFNKTIKEEIDLRRRITVGDEDGEGVFDIRKLAKMIEESDKDKPTTIENKSSDEKELPIDVAVES